MLIIRPEAGEGPIRLWATVAAGALLIVVLLLWAWITDSPDEGPSSDPGSHHVIHLL